jgi:signal transduction histidine kinase
MNRFGVSDALQLSNAAARRKVLGYVYAGGVGIGVLVANYVWLRETASSSDSPVEVLYLVAAAIALSSVDVRIDRGRLSLSGIALGSAAILLSPLNATVVGLSVGVPMVKRGLWPGLGNSATSAAYAFLGAAVASEFRRAGERGLFARLAVLTLMCVVTWIFVAVGISIRTGESIPSIVKHNFSREFYAAYIYFALAALLASYVIDGSLRGYLLASIVFVLSLALTDTIAGRRVRRVLESELSDADRHLFHSRAVEGVVHNLRNHMATTVGYLKEVDPRKLDQVDRESLETATAAADDAVTVLRTLSRGATPRVSYSAEPIELNDLATRAIGMARPRARNKEVELGLRESQEHVKVKADPLLLREVITNLVNNAIDAAPQHGHVELSTGRRSNGWPYFSVADNGPGVADENRHHLFEPHFTTKETGTGLGLFMSYGIVREHQGELTYSGNSRGAVFTVTLPPFSK